MTAWSLAAALLLAVPARAADVPVSSGTAADGPETATPPLPLRCAPSEGPGSCRGRVAGYPKDVVLFFTSWPLPPRARRVLYLHGHNQGFDEVLSYFKFGGLLDASGSKDTVLIVPDGTGPKDRDETYRAEWREAEDAPKRFRAFIDGVEGVLSRTGPPPAKAPTLVFAGHSGAGAIIDRLLACKEKNAVCWKTTREVYLLDGAYAPADFDVYAAFAKKPGNRFLSAYEDTVEHNAEIWAKLVRGRRVEDFDAASVPGEVPREKIRTLTTAFVKSDAGHMELVGKYLPMFLAPAKEFRY